MIPAENEEWHGVWFPGFLFYFLFYFYIYLFSSLNDELDKQILKRYSDDINYNLNLILMTNSSYFLLTILLKN